MKVLNPLLDNSIWIPWVLVPLTVVALLIWTYLESKQENPTTKLEILFEQGKKPYLEIIPRKKPHEVLWEQEVYSKDYFGRFLIRNLSKTETIRKVRVQLLEVTPSQRWITELPLPLRFQHDKQARQEIDINADSEMGVEVFNYFYRAKDKINTRIVLLHSLNDRLIEIYKNIVPMQFEVKITSENGGKSIIKYFKFDNTKNDKNIWIMLDGKKLA